MAVKKGDTVVAEKHGKIELVFVRLEGNDATLQEVVRTFNGLVNRTNGTQLNASTASTSKAALPSRAPAVEVRTDTAPPDATVDGEEMEPEAEDATEAAAPKAPRKYALPTAIPVETEAPLSLTDFLAGYKLDSEQDKYLAFAGWLESHRDKTLLKAGMILTLYARMDWKNLADVTMPLRRMTSKKFQLLERVGRGEFKITQMGQNRLARLKVA